MISMLKSRVQRTSTSRQAEEDRWMRVFEAHALIIPALYSGAIYKPKLHDVTASPFAKWGIGEAGVLRNLIALIASPFAKRGIEGDWVFMLTNPAPSRRETQSSLALLLQWRKCSGLPTCDDEHTWRNPLRRTEQTA